MAERYNPDVTFYTQVQWCAVLREFRSAISPVNDGSLLTNISESDKMTSRAPAHL